MSLWAAITKVDREQRIVYGIASTNAIDSQPGMYKGTAYVGDVIDSAAIEAALPDYLAYANLREMHQPSAVGTIIKAEMIDGQLHIAAKVVDDAAWQKVKEGVYKGFSIGGKALAAALDKVGGQTVRRILKMMLHEISLVDRPANPDAKILLWKGAGMDELEKAADPQKVVQQLQVLRNECELSGDLEGAQLYTQSIAVVMQAAGEAKPAETEKAEESAAAPSDAAADDALLQAAGAKKHPLALRKAGRAFSGANATAMHDVIKALSAILAQSGDEQAAKVAACYGGASPSKDAPMTAEKLATVTGDALTKALGPLLTAHTTTLDALTKRLDIIERQPAIGGPVLRVVAMDKVLGTVGGASTSIADLRKMAANEPNPVKRAEYNRQLRVAETATTR